MANLLVVDDDPINLQIIDDFLSEENHQIIFAADGKEAWEILSSGEDEIHAVILDRLMPEMDGMEVLQHMKASSKLRSIPVIMQTSANNAEEVAEGLAAGAWYYLAKPYRREALVSIVKTALEDLSQHQELKKLSSEISDILGMAAQATFRFRDINQVKELAIMLARICKYEQMVALGLSELLLNAVEHGNLGISYEDKSRLFELGGWQEEVEHRLQQAQYAERYAEIELSRDFVNDEIQFTIRDMGEGFDWQKYLEFDPQRAFDSHGRGIAMARQLAFSSLHYEGVGNVVIMSTAAKSDTH